MSRRQEHLPERDQLELFRALPGDLAARDAQDLMAYPFFSLSKTHRTTPIDCRIGDITVKSLPKLTPFSRRILPPLA